MNDQFEVCWDWSEDGNVMHIREHGVTPNEVDQVLERGLPDRQRDRSWPQRWVVQGYTDAGLFLVVVFELDWVPQWNCWAVYPVTAFYPED